MHQCKFADINFLVEITLMYMCSVLNVNEHDLHLCECVTTDKDKKGDSFFKQEDPISEESGKKAWMLPSRFIGTLVKILLATHPNCLNSTKTKVDMILLAVVENIDMVLHNVKRVSILTSLFVGWQYDVNTTESTTESMLKDVSNFVFRGIAQTAFYNVQPEIKIYFLYAILFEIDLCHRFKSNMVPLHVYRFLEVREHLGSNELVRLAEFFLYCICETALDRMDLALKSQYEFSLESCLLAKRALWDRRILRGKRNYSVELWKMRYEFACCPCLGN